MRYVNRSPHSVVQWLLCLNSLRRPLRLTTLLRLTHRTRLVLWTADSWRVTMKSACFVTSSATVPLTLVLAWALMESAVLLSTRTGGLVRKMWVTASSRCRLIDRPLVLPLSMALQLRGSACTKQLVCMVPVVVTTLLWAVLGCLQVRPLVMALLNSYALRSITLNLWCRLFCATVVADMLLSATVLLLTLQNCTSRPTSAAPFVLADLMTVIPRFGLVMKPMLPTSGCRGLHLNSMRPNIIWFRIGLLVTPVVLVGRGLGCLLLLLNSLKACLVDVSVDRSEPTTQSVLASGLDIRPTHRQNVRVMLMATWLLSIT